MRIPKEIADKLLLKNKLDAELRQYVKDNELDDLGYLEMIDVVDEPTGERQPCTDGDEYCDQVCEMEDWYHGSYYYEVEGTGKYIKCAFDC